MLKNCTLTRQRWMPTSLNWASLQWSAEGGQEDVENKLQNKAHVVDKSAKDQVFVPSA